MVWLSRWLSGDRDNTPTYYFKYDKSCKYVMPEEKWALVEKDLKGSLIMTTLMANCKKIDWLDYLKAL